MQKIDFGGLIKPEIITVDVPELGGAVCIKKMQARDHLEVEKLFTGSGRKGKDEEGNETVSVSPTELAALKVRLCIVNEDGAAVFNADTVWQLDKDTLFSLYAVITQHTDKASSAEVEQTAKN